jgi:phenylpyruvate tautomerase PptA (4-oxalocrotonate tautomerase family)
MPTYVCSVAKNSVNDGQKAAIAEAISRVHSEETGAPSFFVQVVIEEKEPSDRFLGGSCETRHVWVRGDIRAGRTAVQRSAIMLRIMKEVAKITKVKEQDVWVYLNNLLPTDMVEYGHVLPQSGEEAEWFESLPKPLREYLKGLGTSRGTFKL